MNIRIWKYLLNMIDIPQSFMLPKGAKFLSAGLQGTAPTGDIVVWAVCDANPDVEKEERLLKIYGTGWPIEEVDQHGIFFDDRFIGTVQHGAYVWHVFEVFRELKPRKVEN